MATACSSSSPPRWLGRQTVRVRGISHPIQLVSGAFCICWFSLAPPPPPFILRGRNFLWTGCHDIWAPPLWVGGVVNSMRVRANRRHNHIMRLYHTACAQYERGRFGTTWGAWPPPPWFYEDCRLFWKPLAVAVVKRVGADTNCEPHIDKHQVSHTPPPPPADFFCTELFDCCYSSLSGIRLHH